MCFGKKKDEKSAMKPPTGPASGGAGADQLLAGDKPGSLMKPAPGAPPAAAPTPPAAPPPPADAPKEDAPAPEAKTEGDQNYENVDVKK
ncbi:hypothetical protein PMAYCL1PPCAC_11377 [Pristionchus mayeri]|uniref:Uncharacterized protein n=1 Tax=Pristionchus mayeri TaxID=1317129 RepID=A0AAN5CGA0_9BILA|nr:hypothetical protein PMAYCL1PPCAC_11377 [Pristionchus mayeri]